MVNNTRGKNRLAKNIEQLKFMLLRNENYPQKNTWRENTILIQAAHNFDYLTPRLTPDTEYINIRQIIGINVRVFIVTRFAGNMKTHN